MKDLSLLWPADSEISEPGSRLEEDSIRDLGLENTISALGVSDDHRENIRQILFNLLGDPAIICYRQDVIDDLLHHPALVACFEDLLPEITALGEYLTRREHPAGRERSGLYKVVLRLNELQVYVECVTRLSNVLRGLNRDLRSEGLRSLCDFVADVERDETFQHLMEELPELLSEVQSHASVTIGVNLDSELRPVEATLVSVNKERFTSSKLLTRLFRSEANEWEGIADLHALGGQAGRATGPINPMMVPLFRDLSNVLSRVSRSIEQALKQYAGLNTRLVVDLKGELVFYLAAVRMIEIIRASGLPMCKPELAPAEERVCEVKESYNANLALHLVTRAGQDDLRAVVVRNNVTLGPQGRVAILTGPNLGGKTTYLQAIGLTQVLAQAGIYVPGQQARISPVDAIYTHYPIEESLEKGTGRFGDEAKRLNDIFARATRHSLVLLNESLSSTSPGESLYLARDIVRVLRRMGVRAIFVTHLHELAVGLDSLNAEPSGDSQAISIVASFVEEEIDGAKSGAAIKRTYEVAPGPPMGYSCAQEIAARYGISYEQLVEALAARGVLTESYNYMEDTQQ